jgi:hypothetical protein
MRMGLEERQSQNPVVPQLFSVANMPGTSKNRVSSLDLDLDLDVDLDGFVTNELSRYDRAPEGAERE